MTEMNRRKFLITGGVLTAGAVLTACGKNAKNTAITLAPTNGLIMASTTNDIVVNAPGRVAFVLQNDGDFIDPTGIVLRVGRDANGPFKQPVVSTVYKDTGDGAPAYVVANIEFTKTGAWFVEGTLKGKTTTAPVNVIPASASTVPKPGEKLIPFDSPTTSNAQGVDPICTRSPQCPLHDQTITAAMNQHKPFALLFATPARCESKTCGPVLDTLLSVKDGNSTPIYLHQEIYQNKDSQKLAPVDQAYMLTSEPVLFLADSDNTIRYRIDGLFGKAEVEELLSKLS